MIKCIQTELYKLFKNRAFKVLMIIAILLAVLTIFMGSKFFNQIIMDSLGSLPEAQKDRFMMALSIGYPDLENEISIIEAQRSVQHPIENIKACISTEDIVTSAAPVSKIIFNGSPLTEHATS